MADKTMHHVVIGSDTYEIVDSVARENVSVALSAYPTDTASGAVATFSDGADGVPVKSLSVGIEPAQSGSGDPSPTNIRPISGWDAVKVFRTGKNLFDPTKLTTQSAWKDVKLDLPEGTYTMSDTLVEGSLSLYFILVGGTKSAATKVHSTHPVTLTISAGQKAQISFRRASGEDVFSNYTYQIEVGSTATDYEPYNGTVYDIDLPQTVYGGTLDVASGVLTVDKVAVNLGSLTWQTRYTGSINKALSTNLDEYYPVTSDTSDSIAEDYTVSYVAGASSLRNPDSLSPTLYRYYNALTAHTKTLYAVVGVDDAPTGLFVYPVESPQTIQLTPQEVSTLLGDNNIYADAGEVAVTYRADTGLYIDKRLNA